MPASFKVKNAQGKVFTAYEIGGAMKDASALIDTKRQKFEGLRSYKLQDGTHLNTDDLNTFTNAATGEILTRVLPTL